MASPKRPKKGAATQALHQLLSTIAPLPKETWGDEVARRMEAGLVTVELAASLAEALTKKQELFKRSVELLPQVWRNWEVLNERYSFTIDQPTGDVLAALLSARLPSGRRQEAIGNSVLRMAPRYVLMVSTEMFDLTPTERDKVLKHELLHMGYTGHGEDFRRAAVAVGAAISGASVTDGREPGVYAAKKVGARYAVMKRFDTQREAELWVMDETKRAHEVGEPRTRWRLEFI